MVHIQHTSVGPNMSSIWVKYGNQVGFYMETHWEVL